MRSRPIGLVFIAAWLTVPSAMPQQLQRQLTTEKGNTSDALVPHPLAWWTENPLRDDISGDLLLDTNPSDGHGLTFKDYKTDQKITTIGVLAGFKIVQIRTTIVPDPRAIAAGLASAEGFPTEWKDLLAGPENGDAFVELYALHYDVGGLIKITDAALYGTGPNAILGTYDPDTGNGGGCADGYWWFDSKGPHELDFSPLTRAISRAIPAKSTYASGCYALDMKHLELNSHVQSKDAQCHACGNLGEVNSSFRIDHGKAVPIAVHFEPEQQ